MKSRLIAVLLLAGASAFAQSRFSVVIGGGSRYGYAPAPVYNGYGGYGGYGYGGGYGYSAPGGYYRSGGAGYWGMDPDRAHRRAEWNGLRNHHMKELYEEGDSPELREHQAEEREQLRREQWQERYGDAGAAYGPAHGSAYDGMHQH